MKKIDYEKLLSCYEELFFKGSVTSQKVIKSYGKNIHYYLLNVDRSVDTTLLALFYNHSSKKYSVHNPESLLKKINEVENKILLEKQANILEKQANIQKEHKIIDMFVFAVLFLQLIATGFIGYQTIKIQSNEPDIVLATSEEDNLINLNYWKNYPFENYIIYIHNKGNAPCYNLKLHNVKFVESFNRIIRADSNNLIERALDVKKEYRTLLKPTNCWGNIASSPDEILEPTCYLDIGLIYPNEIIPIGVMVNIKGYNEFKNKMYDQKKFIKKDDAMIKFDIKASCGKSKYELPVIMTDSIENAHFNLIKDDVYGN